MAYTLYPIAVGRSECSTVVIYNDLQSILATEQSGTLTALSFRLRSYNSTEYTTTAITVTNPATNTVWGTISTDDLIAYRIGTLNTTPGTAVYTLTVTYTDASTDVITYNNAGSSWATIFNNLVGDLAVNGYGIGVYDSVLTSLFIGNGTKTISTIVITADDSDLEVYTPTQTTDTFENGIYVLEVSYTVDAVDYTTEFYIPIVCQIEQCILRLIGRIPELESCNKCDDTCIDYILTANGMLEALQIMDIYTVTDITEAQTIISRLEDICNNEDCQCYD